MAKRGRPKKVNPLMKAGCLKLTADQVCLSKELDLHSIGALQRLPHGESLIAALEVWAGRRPKYGDGWKDNKEYHTLAMVCEKFRRLEHQFTHPTGTKVYETKEDTLIDLVNWALFYLQNLKDGKYGGNK